MTRGRLGLEIQVPLRLYLCVKVGDFEKKSVCVKPGTARFAARKTIKYYPLSPYAKRLPFGPAIPSGCTRGAVLCPRSVSYTSSTERMTQGPPRFCLRLLPAESARFLIENACDFCTEIARFNRLFARNRMFSARSRRLILAYLHA